jgi:hypothetical protein
MKTAFRVVSSLVIAAIFTLVLQEFSFRELQKKVVRVSGGRESAARQVRKEFFLDRLRESDVYVLEAAFFERRQDDLNLNLSINETRVLSFTADRKLKIIDIPASSLRNGKNSLAVTADRAWSFKSLRLKNIYGYSSGFPKLAVINKKNELGSSGSPRDVPFYLIFLFLFFSSVLVLNLTAGRDEAATSKKFRAVISLRYVVLVLFALVLVSPLLTKYRIVLGFRSVLHLAAIYLGLLYLAEIKNFLAGAAREFLRFITAWQEPLAVFAITRLGIYGLGYLSSLVINKGAWFSTHLPSHFLNLFFKWDSYWHHGIADLGYSFIPGKPSNIAFFPLYPMTAQFSSFFAGDLRANGFIISNLALLLAVFYLVKLVRLEFGDDASASRSVLYLLVFPGSLFFSYFYSEALFLFLTLAAFYSARKRRWPAASIFGCLAGLTKVTGVFILVPLLIEYFEPRFQDRKFRLNPVKIEALWLALVPLGLLAFMATCGLRFGDPLAFIHAQAVWGTSALAPGAVLTKILMLPPFYRMLYVGLMVFALLMIAVLILKKFRASYVAYAGLLLVVYLAFNALESTPRQLSVVFPLFIGMAVVGKNKLAHHFLVFASIALLALFTILSANGYWFV